MSRDEIARVDRAFKRYLSRNRGGAVRVVVRRVACATADLEIELTFAVGVTYCCFESGCHLGIFTRERWASLRQCMQDEGLVFDAPLTVSVRNFSISLSVRLVERVRARSDGLLKVGGHVAVEV